MRSVNWDKVIDSIQAAMVWFIIVLVALCTTTLILFDVFAGTGIDYALTQGNFWVSLTISMATTGLLMSLMFIGYALADRKSASILIKLVGKVILICSAAVFCLDVVFDSLSADILSFGKITDLATVSNPSIHWLFRILLGGISVIGEALALAIIMGMPVLKTIINDALPPSYQSTQHNQSYRPAPNQNQYRYDTASPAFNNLPKKKPDLVPASSLNRPVYPRPAARPAQTTFMSEPTYHPIRNLNLEDYEGNEE